MKKQVAVIGLGRFGTSLATKLFTMGHEVLAIDVDEKIVQDIADDVTQAVQADATNEEEFDELQLGDFDVAVVAIGTSIERSVLTTVLLKKLKEEKLKEGKIQTEEAKPFIIARAETLLHETILKRVGADRVVRPENAMGEILAHEITVTAIKNYIPVAQNYGVAKMEAPAYFLGKRLHDLGFGRGGELGLAVLLIQRADKAIVTPDRWETVEDQDVLIVSGPDDKLEKLIADALKQTKKKE